jgi:hypothetical protein
MPLAPNVDNYTLGKGIVYFNPFDSDGLLTVERDLGNCPAFTFNIAIEKLEHFSSRGGINSKDKEIISQITPSVSFTLDELSAENINMFVMGDMTGGGASDANISAFANTQIEGRLRFVSDNPAGNQQQIIIHKVSLAPDGDAALIGNEWATLAFTGEILKDTENHPSSPYMDITVSADAIAS